MQFAAKAAAASMILRKRMNAASPEETAASAFLLMSTARDLGLPPTTGLNSMYIIEGSVVLSTHLYGALAQRSGKAKIEVAEGEGWCEVTMTRTDNGMHFTSRWDLERAKTAGLAGKNNWTHHPAAMLRARAQSECAKVVLPDVVFGLYTPDDFGFTDDQASKGEHCARVVDVTEDPDTPIGEEAEKLIRRRHKDLVDRGVDEAALVADLNTIRDTEKKGERRPAFATLPRAAVRACLRMLDKAEKALPPTEEVAEGSFTVETPEPLAELEPLPVTQDELEQEHASSMDAVREASAAREAAREGRVGRLQMDAPGEGTPAC